MVNQLFNLIICFNILLFFSLSHHNLSIELQETPSHIGKLQCQDCNFGTQFFHLLLPHLKTHANAQDLGQNFHAVQTDGTMEHNIKLDCSECGKIFKKSDVLE